MRQNLILSISVALVGILAPIALSLLAFVVIFRSTVLQGFTAGAALCSTSLGTTFAVLTSLPGSGATDLRSTRIGTVLLSAAILDDVVGLIMASVVTRVAIPTGPSSTGPALAWTILQPVVASTGMALITPLVVRWLILPVFRRTIVRIAPVRQDALLLPLFVLSLSAMLTISHYTGSSPLFGAFVTGCALRYLDVTVGDPLHNFQHIFATYIEPCNERLLVPLFFSSIGAAIPFVSLWKPSIIWKGIVYSILMCIGKATTGLCILFWPSSTAPSIPSQPESMRQNTDVPRSGSTLQTAAIPPLPTAQPKPKPSARRKIPVYPALFLSLAMIARGEIALLIAQIGRAGLGEEPFLVVMWAAVVCTLVGPLGTGWLVRRRAERCVEAGWD